MSYENAPQTQLVATHCAACGRPLVDAVSVEVGMGPDCRARLLRSVQVDAAAHKEANQLVYRIAVIQKGIDVLEPLERLRELGFVKLADRIEKRCRVNPRIVIQEKDGELFIRTPFDFTATQEWRSIPGRRWCNSPEPDQEFKGRVNAVPKAQKRAVWNLLLKYYHGKVAKGPKGFFIIRN